jgi:3-phenylpropionate/cinnamic acid dioxygenase small subunit
MHLQGHDRGQLRAGIGSRRDLRQLKRDAARPRRLAARGNIYERHVYRHFLGQPWIVAQDASEVRSETSFFVARIMRDGTTDVYATGRYIDAYKLNGAELKLRERIVVCDSSRFDTLLALPL